MPPKLTRLDRPLPHPRQFSSAPKRARATFIAGQLADRLDSALHDERDEAAIIVARQIATRHGDAANALETLKALMEDLPSQVAQSLVFALMVDEGYSTHAMETFCRQFPNSCDFQVLFQIANSEVLRNMMRNRTDAHSALTALTNAATNNNSLRVRFMLAAGADVNSTHVTNLTLARASEYGHADIVALLLNARADPRNNIHEDALMHAVTNRHEDVVRLLLRARTDPNHIGFFTNHLGSPLAHASMRGYANIVSQLLAARANVSDNEDEALTVAIPHRAPITQEHFKVVRRLLHARADVHAREDFALARACGRGAANIVELLLNANADVNARIAPTMLHEATEGAIHDDTTHVVQLLLNAGADVHAADDVALRNASYNGSANIVALLLSAGANANARETASLIWASRNGHVDIVRLLLDAGANPRARTDSALRHATNFLRQYVASGHLHFAARHREVVRMLRDAGSRIGRGRPIFAIF